MTFGQNLAVEAKTVFEEKTTFLNHQPSKPSEPPSNPASLIWLIQVNSGSPSHRSTVCMDFIPWPFF